MSPQGDTACATCRLSRTWPRDRLPNGLLRICGQVTAYIGIVTVLGDSGTIGAALLSRRTSEKGRNVPASRVHLKLQIQKASRTSLCFGTWWRGPRPGTAALVTKVTTTWHCLAVLGPTRLLGLALLGGAGLQPAQEAAKLFQRSLCRHHPVHLQSSGCFLILFRNGVPTRVILVKCKKEAKPIVEDIFLHESLLLSTCLDTGLMGSS